MPQQTFIDSVLGFLRDNPLIAIGLILAIWFGGMTVIRMILEYRLRVRNERISGMGEGFGGQAEERPPRSGGASFEPPAPQEIPEEPEISTPEADTERPPASRPTYPRGEAVTSTIHPDQMMSQEERDRWMKEILGDDYVAGKRQKEEADEPFAPASEKPASPAQPARRREQEEPDRDEAVTPVAPAGSQLPPLPPREQPAPAAPSPAVPPLDDGLSGSIPDKAEPAEEATPVEVEDEEAPAAEAPAPAEPAPTPIQFSAHYPREIKPGPDEWQPLLAYLYRETAADAVDADAKERLGPRPDVRVTRRPALSQVQAGALVIATPVVPGLEFNPPSAVVRFVKDWHRFEFEFRAVDAPLDEAANGRITFMVEGLIVGDVPLSIYVSESAASTAIPQVTQAHPYRAIFCSYSHKDTAIVELVELAVRTLGDQYLRDMTTLRSGEDWNDALMRMIDAADIFQLFWSENAAGSKFVEEEWRYALSLKASQAKDAHFLRPVRWVDPINPNPPGDLGRIEFFYEPRLLHWQQIQPGDPQPPVGLHPGGSGGP